MALFGGGNDIRIRFLADTTQVGAAVKETGAGISQGLGLAQLGWAAAGAAAITFGKQSVDAALEAEDAQNRLATAYAKFPALHDVTLQSLNDLADATLEKSRFDDEAARSAITLLSAYNLTGQQIEQLLPLVIDYAAKTGKELPDAASSIGKALLGNTRALKEVGISYKSTGDAATDYANILQLLKDKVGGAAAADAETTAGKMAMLANQYGELKEQIGMALLPLLQQIIPILIPILEVLAMSFTGWGLAIQWVVDHAYILGDVLSFLVAPFVWLWNMQLQLIEVLGQLGGAISTAAGFLMGVFGGAISWVIGLLQDIWGHITDVANVVGGVFAGAFDIAKGAIDGVAGAIRWVINKLEDLKSVWDSVSGFISSIGGIVGLSAPVPPSGGSGAPALSLAGSGRSRAAGSSFIAPAGGLVVNVNVHGNVGDPNLIGRRVVDALATYSRTNGARALRTNMGLT